VDQVDVNSVATAIAIIIVAIAGAITRWRLSKKQDKDGPNGP
jgi:hypothetical protein